MVDEMSEIYIQPDLTVQKRHEEHNTRGSDEGGCN
jgi:hypothetical protein